MKVYGDLEKAQVETRAGAPTTSKTGEIVVDSTDTNQLKYADGTANRTVVNTDQAQTLTNKTLTSPVVNTPTGIVKGDVGLGNVDNTSDATKDAAAATLANKTLTAPNVNDPITNVQTLTEQGSSPSNPSAGKKKFYAKTDGKIYTLDSAGNEIEVGAGGSGGGINYATNPDFESGVADVTTTANITESEETTNPIRGTKSLNLEVGTGATTADNADIPLDVFDDADSLQSKKIHISFEYFVDANYTTDDTQMVIRDVTGAVDLPIYNDEDGKLIATTNIKKFQGYFFTTAGNTDYSLRANVLVAPSTASNLKIDTVEVGPDSFIPGAIITEWQSYTPTFNGFGTPTDIDCWWRQVGENYELSIDFASGTNTASEARVSLPNGKSVKSLIAPSNKNVGGVGDSYATDHDYTVLIQSADTYVKIGRNDTAASGLVALDGNIFGNGSVITFTVSVPIEGLSAGASISTTETLFSTVAIEGRGNGGTALTANVTDIDFTETDDEFSLWDGSVFTAPKPAWYSIDGHIRLSGSSNAIYAAYINGTKDIEMSSNALANYKTFNGMVKLNAGDTLSIRSDTSDTLVNAVDEHWIVIKAQPDFSTFSVWGETDYRDASSAGLVNYVIAAGNWGDLSSLTIPAYWAEIEFSVVALYYNNGATTTTTANTGISTNSGNDGTGLILGDNRMFLHIDNTNGHGNPANIPKYRVLQSAETTYYLKGQASTSITNLQIAYTFTARKIK